MRTRIYCLEAQNIALTSRMVTNAYHELGYALQQLKRDKEALATNDLLNE